MLFTVREPMQPNSYTISKKTNVAVTLTFALCIPLFSTTKNIQLVTLPKYLRTYEVWHFNKSTDALFKGYIRRFMKIKLESSNYDFKTKEEEANFKARIKDSLDIDIEKFEFNAGLRSISRKIISFYSGRCRGRSHFSWLVHSAALSNAIGCLDKILTLAD